MNDTPADRRPYLYNLSITKTRLFKYIENFTTENWKFADKNSDIFFMYNVYPCKPQFYYIKVGF